MEQISDLPARADGIVQIYGLIDPRTQELRYVGKTKDLQSRYRDHMRLRKNCYLRNWIRQVKTSGLKPDMFVIETVTEANWPDAERYWINYFEFVGSNLCNRHGGGWGGNYKPFDAEHRRKIGDAHRGIKRGPLSDERKSKISTALRGRKYPGRGHGHKGATLSEEAKRKISIANSGRKHPNKRLPPHTEEHKRHISESLKGRPSPTKGMTFGPMSEERRQHLSKIKTGVKRKPFTAEHCRKISEAAKGRKMPPFTDEHRRKISEARKRIAAVKRAEKALLDDPASN